MKEGIPCSEKAIAYKLCFDSVFHTLGSDCLIVGGFSAIPSEGNIVEVSAVIYLQNRCAVTPDDCTCVNSVPCKTVKVAPHIIGGVDSFRGNSICVFY